MASKKSKVVKFGDVDIVFKELDVSEVRSLMGIKPVDYIDAFALDGITLSELAYMAGIAVEEFDRASSGDLDELCSAAKEVNPLFFGIRDRLGKLVERVQ
ncbi:hypothetical protein [Aquitalea aquatilis]|uniref:hypothetical protein n=1 Tax=Aquitalea aquatilis TaxID=1537400 RepID=UPI0010BD4F1E|nr:hypothetical protein [Aquitalea aquatilis]